jgi:hypothetical protein
MRDEASSGPNIEGVLTALRRRQLDQSRGDAGVLTSCPAVVDGGDPVEEVDQVVDHLVR